MSGASKTKIDKESLRREIAADLGIKIDANDPLLLAAHVAAIVTRDTIAQERAHNAENQLLSYGDVRTVLMDVRDETIKVTDQIVGVVWMTTPPIEISVRAMALQLRCRFFSTKRAGTESTIAYDIAACACRRPRSDHEARPDFCRASRSS